MQISIMIWVVLLLVAPSCVWCDDWWMDQPYGNNDSFNIRSEYLTNVSLACEAPLNYVFQYWIRPDLEVMKAGDRREEWTLDGYSTMEVLPGGTMEIVLLQEGQFGFYHCVSQKGVGDVYINKKAVNYNGPYFGNLWDEYRMNTIIGVSSAAVFLVLCLICYGINRAFCKGDEEDEEDKPMEMTSTSIEPTSDPTGRYEQALELRKRSPWDEGGAATNIGYMGETGNGSSPVDVELATSL